MLTTSCSLFHIQLQNYFQSLFLLEKNPGGENKLGRNIPVICKYNGRIKDLKTQGKEEGWLQRVVQTQEKIHLNWLWITDCWETGGLLTTSSKVLQSIFPLVAKQCTFNRAYLEPCIWGGCITFIFNLVVFFFFPLTQNLMWLQVMPPICNAPLSEMGTATWSMARSGGAVVSVETWVRLAKARIFSRNY